MGIAKKNTDSICSTMKAIVHTDRLLLFFQFDCPHCGGSNVISKAYKTEVVLCSNSSCHMMVIIDNYEEIV